MKKIKLLSLLFMLMLLSSATFAKHNNTTTIPSKDGLLITIDSYMTKKAKLPLIVLFHQAGWSRGEYKEIAPKLNELGFNAIAVDLRSGNKVNNIVNETAKRAKKAHKNMNYVAALQDIEAALVYARSLVDEKTKVIAWGSSYSSALVLKIAGDHPELVDAVLSFSPGEYFTRMGKPANWIQQSVKSYNKPVFITSARTEANRWKPIFNAIKSNNKIGFIPRLKGNHGSRALWKSNKGNEEYWKAVTKFLQDLKK